MIVGAPSSNPTDEVPTHLKCWSVKRKLNKAYEKTKVIKDLNILGACVTTSCSCIIK